MHISQISESKYLKQSDAPKPLLVTIKEVTIENLAKEGDPKEEKWIIHFKEDYKPMVLNKTNANRTARATGSEDTDDWAGKQIVVYVDPDVEFAGQVTGGLRIRAKKGEPAGGDFDDEIPFNQLPWRAY